MATKAPEDEHAVLTGEEAQRLLTMSPAVHYVGVVGRDYASSYISASVYDQLGYTPEAFMEDSDFFANHIHPEDRERVLKKLSAISLSQNDHNSMEYRFLHADGSYRWMHDELNIVRDDAGNPQEGIGYWIEITERKETEEALRKAHEEMTRLAIHDELTGLYNRRELLNRLAQEVQRSQRYQHSVALVMLDLDHFKAINDTYGHPVGDEALRRVGLAISECGRDIDTAARYGGEEFSILLPETNVDSALVVAERVCNSIASLSIPVAPETTVNVTASIGIATFPDHSDSEQTLLSAADAALYEAKHSGRNRVCVR